MRLSHISVVIAATFLLASATPTDSNQAKIVQARLQEGLSQRLLRTHPTTYEDDDSEERGPSPTLLEKLNFKRMRMAGTTADEYAEKLALPPP
uniref:RxLR effector protein n=1 Tax=Phytophthora lateralis TaxID=129355 RepID=U5Y7Q0_9STRA|nr:RXLR-class effector Avh247 [Phytophthora lateralis]